MPRRPRRDKPGRLHHVVNRGQDRQKIFHRDADCRFFLALLACAVLRGRIRLHAFCLMPNHFHLLVESVDGNLSATMQWIQGRYASYFNATHEHAGHLFGARFHSNPVLSVTYLLTLLRYIDRNPIKAEDAQDPLTMQWCSAFHHARQGPRPHWLARDIVDKFLAGRIARGEERSAAYRYVFRIAVPDPAGDEIVERRMASGFWVDDELDCLLQMGPVALAEWMLRRATRDDPLRVRLVYLDIGTVADTVSELRRAEGLRGMILGGVRRRDALMFIESALMRDFTGCTFEAAARRLETSISSVQQRYAVHRQALHEDEAYLGLVGYLLHRALARAHGSNAGAVARLHECV